MQAIVLAVDDAAWTHPLAPDEPTASLPVGEASAAEHLVRAASAAGADRVTLVDPDGVGDRISDDVAYERAPDLAAAVAAGSGAFALLPGCVLLDAATVAALHDRGPALAVTPSGTPSRYGSVTVENGHVRTFHETDTEDAVAFTGAATLPARCRDVSSPGDYAALVAAGVDSGIAVVTADRWHDLERPWELLAANADALESLDARRDGRVHPDADLRGTVVVAPDATVNAGVVVDGPAFVGRGATVGPNAYVRGATYLGPDVHVGHAVEVKNSVLLAGASAGHLTYLGDSVVGRDVNFGAGTVVANLRHDGAAVRVATTEGRLSTGRRKFGIVAGERAKTGIDASVDAGVTLGPGARTAPGETLVRDREN